MADPPVSTNYRAPKTISLADPRLASACPQDTYVKRIIGTYTDALSPEPSFLNSLQLECSNNELTTVAGGFDPTTSVSSKTFKLECPSWRFLPTGTAFNKQDYSVGGPSQLKLSNNASYGVGVVRNLVLDCGDAERIKNGPPPGEVACSKYMKQWLLHYHQWNLLASST
jgi:hypothetical protein